MLQMYVEKHHKSQFRNDKLLLMRSAAHFAYQQTMERSSKRPTVSVQRIYKCPDTKFLRTDFCDSYEISYDVVIEMKSAVMTFSIEMDGKTVASVEVKYE